MNTTNTSPLKLWLISQTACNGYDSYDSAVVAAVTEEDARNIHPGFGRMSVSSSWCQTPEQVSVEYLGLAEPTVEPGVVLASFNAG